MSDRNNLPYTNSVINLFPSPRTFEPSRFIDDNGKLKKVNLFHFQLGNGNALGKDWREWNHSHLPNLFNRFKHCRLIFTAAILRRATTEKCDHASVCSLNNVLAGVIDKMDCNSISPYYMDAAMNEV
ncbi:hypothetical protein KIN20_035012 [Parelaphostrongylus tenuis]|uniref:Uncharacterized protein n=1 Tax=Parelaphostrongylus tenuis TaxID=148309 RepID=A0AAD5RDH1_PARTN|nr:hypothetical protein KIN20_035012 [Parelaphostrongylus tenuis]